jgi:hypothetical protein
MNAGQHADRDQAIRKLHKFDIAHDVRAVAVCDSVHESEFGHAASPPLVAAAEATGGDRVVAIATADTAAAASNRNTVVAVAAIHRELGRRHTKRESHSDIVIPLTPNQGRKSRSLEPKRVVSGSPLKSVLSTGAIASKNG